MAIKSQLRFKSLRLEVNQLRSLRFYKLLFWWKSGMGGGSCSWSTRASFSSPKEQRLAFSAGRLLPDSDGRCAVVTPVGGKPLGHVVHQYDCLGATHIYLKHHVPTPQSRGRRAHTEMTALVSVLKNWNDYNSFPDEKYRALLTLIFSL